MPAQPFVLQKAAKERAAKLEAKGKSVDLAELIRMEPSAGNTNIRQRQERPTAFFAGVWTPQWRSVRKVKEGEVEADLYAFLTTDPNEEVKAIHPKAMPVVLTTPEQCETWMTADWPIASYLQRPLPDGSLDIVARGGKKDGDTTAYWH